jgi:hypothetical protein
VAQTVEDEAVVVVAVAVVARLVDVEPDKAPLAGSVAAVVAPTRRSSAAASASSVAR